MRPKDAALLRAGQYAELAEQPSELVLTGYAVSCKLLVSPTRRLDLVYSYSNPSPNQVDLWLSLPRSSPAQSNIRVQFSHETPLAIHGLRTEGEPSNVSLNELDDLLNDRFASGFINFVAHYKIPPKRRVRLTCAYDAAATQLVAPEEAEGLVALGWNLAERKVRLCGSEREYYLRSTPLVRIDEATAAEATALACMGACREDGGEADAQMQRLRRLFDHLTSSTYRYLWPPPARGSTSMRTSQTGDCGNYSALFAAWCRSLKLPARVVIGTWTRGIMQAHAWCEVFIDDIGWVPVDASVAASLRVNRAHFDGLIDAPAGFPPAVQPETYLGALDRGRLAFSFEMDPHALPGYQEWSSPPSGAPRLSHSTGDVYWGYTLLNGKAPYLQPAYPLFHGPVSKVSDKRLLGTWELILHASCSIPRMAGPAALAAAALVLLVLILNHGSIRREMAAHAFAAACGVFAGIRAIQGSARVINSVVAISLFSVLAWRLLR